MCGIMEGLSAAGLVMGLLNKPKMPNAPAPVAAPPASQAAKMPDQQAQRAAQVPGSAAMGSASSAGTMLTGASGVDPSLLNLGKNTLLGA